MLNLANGECYFQDGQVYQPSSLVAAKNWYHIGAYFAFELMMDTS